MSIEERRSIRKYTNQPVEKAVIEEVIRAATLAPSAKNRQPWKYLVYAGAEKEKLVDQMEIGLYREREVSPILPESAFGLPDAYNTLRIMRQAPMILVVLNTNGRNPYEEIDTDHRISEICDSLSIGASIENLILKATELGLGTLWNCEHLLCVSGAGGVHRNGTSAGERDCAGLSGGGAERKTQKAVGRNSGIHVIIQNKRNRAEILNCYEAKSRGMFYVSFERNGSDGW